MTVQAAVQTLFATQSVFETAVTPTVKIMGVDSCKITPDIKTMVLNELRGSLQPGWLSELVEVTGGAVINYSFLSYEDAAYTLSGLLGIAAPSGVGPYTRAWSGPTAAPTPRILTIEHGITGRGGHRLIGAIPTQAVISGEYGGDGVKAVVTYIGREVVPVASITALTDRTVTPVMPGDVVVALDNFGVAAGTTPFVTTSYAFELTLNNQAAVKGYLGEIRPEAYELKRHDATSNTLKLSVEWNAAAQTQTDLAITAAVVYSRVIQLDFTRGTNQLTFNYAGVMNGSPEAFDDRDGVLAADLNLQAINETTLGNWLTIENINDVATLL